MSVTQKLQQFYDAQAEKFVSTRRKHRPEFEHLLAAIPVKKRGKLKVLEIGCGGGRFAAYLAESYEGKIDYTGIDISGNLLEKAQEAYPE